MITLQEIENALGDCKVMAGEVSMSTIATLSNFTNIELLMNENSYDYYYALDVETLMESQADADCLKDLVNDGWSLSKDKKKIIKYLKNFI